jgi:ketosteroid isomerase-like protein
VREEAITEEDIERMKRGFALFNEENFDALREFFAPDVVIERAGQLAPLKGWDEFRALQEPDAFAWQRVHPLDWIVNGDKVLIRIRSHSKGAASGVELELEGWLVWTVRDGQVVHMINTNDEAHARAAAGLGQNDSS